MFIRNTQYTRQVKVTKNKLIYFFFYMYYHHFETSKISKYSFLILFNAHVQLLKMKEEKN